ncbi:MAG TPA: DNA polymerase III subunit delta [Burkholderiales bacterium]|nr:DNA polymerase III subunit delta [Burkholderiales bacterium]
MELRADQLRAHLERSLSPVYAVHGDEPLLALEAADAVRAAARRAGYAEREVYEPGRGFDWGEFRHASASVSLFGERKLVELRLTSGKVAAPAAEALVGWCEAPSAEALLLVTMPRPEGPGWWKAPWFTALKSAGVVVGVEPVSRQALPDWLRQRLALQKQHAAVEVLAWLADRVEGNLLAAHQELQKLALIAPEGELDLTTVREATADVARYDPYLAAEALVAGDAARYVRVIGGLRAEGEQPTFVLHVISSALFGLQGRGRVFHKALARALEAAAGRQRPAAIERALRHAARIDRAIKGVGGGDPWEELIVLGLNLADGSGA